MRLWERGRMLLGLLGMVGSLIRVSESKIVLGWRSPAWAFKL